MAKSIMHNKDDRTCYLCMLLRDDCGTKVDLQEHHAMPGTANRRLSERYGLKVYLCIEHHLVGPEAVHSNIRLRRLLQANAQMAFERRYSHEKWMEAFGRNFL